MPSSTSSESAGLQSFQLKLNPSTSEVYNMNYNINSGPAVEKSGFKFQLFGYNDSMNYEVPDSEARTLGIFIRCERVPSADRVSRWTLQASVLTDSQQWVPFHFDQDTTERFLDFFLYNPNNGRDIRIEEIQLKDPFNWSKPDVFSDVILVVEDQEFYACKAILATFSDLFRGMFIREFKEAKMPRCDVQGVKAQQLQELLNVIYHKSEIDARNVLQILELDDYLGMPVIKAKCFKVLAQLKDSEVSLSSRILLADQYPSLNDLLDATLKPLNTPTEVKKALPADLSSLSPATVLKLLKKMKETVERIEEDNRRLIGYQEMIRHH